MPAKKPNPQKIESVKTRFQVLESIHLFGRSDLLKLALAQTTASEFGIVVTFEEVQ
jgi:hypothetical protein